MVLCFGGVVVATEGAWGLLWVAGNATIGSPVACVYMLQRLIRGESIAIGAVLLTLGVVVKKRCSGPSYISLRILSRLLGHCHWTSIFLCLRDP